MIDEARPRRLAALPGLEHVPDAPDEEREHRRDDDEEATPPSGRRRPRRHQHDGEDRVQHELRSDTHDAREVAEADGGEVAEIEESEEQRHGAPRGPRRALEGLRDLAHADDDRGDREQLAAAGRVEMDEERRHAGGPPRDDGRILVRLEE